MLKSYQIEIEKLVKISKFAGERFDLVQAGGGNTSVKLDDDNMAIKASGFALSDVELSSGYAIVNNKMILDILESPKIANYTDIKKRDEDIKQMVDNANLTKNIRPSIETFLHSLLSKYTLHTHSIAANNILCGKDWVRIINEIFHTKDFAIVPYHDPGIDLAMGVKESIEEFFLVNKKLPEVVFMQNHGIIVSSDDADLVMKKTDEVTRKIEDYLGIKYNDYKLTNKISNLINNNISNYQISYLCCDTSINNLLKQSPEIFHESPACPDVLVFCGIACCFIKNLEDQNSILEFNKKYQSLPKIIIWQDKIFFIAKNISKAREIEDVFKFHLLTIKNLSGEKNLLSKETISYLLDWEAEKYRQNLKQH